MKRPHVEWTFSRTFKRKTARVPGLLDLHVVVEDFTRHGGHWQHVRVYEKETLGNGLSVAHEAIVRSEDKAMAEAERALRAAAVLCTEPEDPLREIENAVYAGRMPSLEWMMRHGDDHYDAAVSAWNTSSSAGLMLDYACLFHQISPLYDFRKGMPTSRVLSGLCCRTALWPGEKRPKRYEILRSAAQADDIRRRLPAPTFAQCLVVIEIHRAHQQQYGHHV